MNQVILIGRVVRDCEINILQNQNKTNVMKFTLAVERDYENKNGETPVDFINIEHFGNDFSKLKNYVLKGTKLGVIGSINIDKVNEKSFLKVKANKIELLETKNPKMEQNGILNTEKEQKEILNTEKEQKSSYYNTMNVQKGDYSRINEDDEDVPF